MKKNYKKIDDLWRLAVYKRAGNICEFCGRSGKMHAHHIFSRSNYALRWETQNGICLCVSHHVLGNLSFHKAPAEMMEWIKDKRGEEWYDKLIKDSHIHMKREAAREKYEPILKEILQIK